MSEQKIAIKFPLLRKNVVMDWNIGVDTAEDVTSSAVEIMSFLDQKKFIFDDLAFKMKIILEKLINQKFGIEIDQLIDKLNKYLVDSLMKDFSNAPIFGKLENIFFDYDIEMLLLVFKDSDATTVEYLGNSIANYCQRKIYDISPLGNFSNITCYYYTTYHLSSA